MQNQDRKTIYTTVSIDKEAARLIEKICKRYSLKKGEIVKLAFRYLDKANINPADAPESVKSELSKINKRQDDINTFHSTLRRRTTQSDDTHKQFHSRKI